MLSAVHGGCYYLWRLNIFTGTVKAGNASPGLGLGLSNNKRFVVSHEPDSNLNLICPTMKVITGGSD